MTTQAADESKFKSTACSRSHEALEMSLEELQECPSASVEGIIKSVTPVKIARRYYNFTIVNGTCAVRAVNFNDSSHSQLLAFNSSKRPVKIYPVSVKRQRTTAGYEIVASKHSKFTESGHVKDITDQVPDIDSDMFIELRNISALSVDEEVNIKIKVTKLAEIEEIKKEGKILRKRDVTIADSTAAVPLVLWENNVNQLELLQSYHIIGAKIKQYLDTVYISLTSSTTIRIVDNIGTVAAVDSACMHASTSTQQEPSIQSSIVIGEIIGCRDFDIYYSCIYCKGRLCSAEPRDEVPEYMVCSCSAYVKVAKCNIQFCCKILVSEKGNNGKNAVELEASSTDLLKILPSPIDIDSNPDVTIGQVIVQNGTDVKVEYFDKRVKKLDTCE